MKVRIGVGMGESRPSGSRPFLDVVDRIDELGFDSLWLPEVLTAPTLDPVTALAHAAAHNAHLKLGCTLVLPGRNIVRTAKELATLDVLSNGRLLTTFVPGLIRRGEADAVGIAAPDRGVMMEEAMPVLRSLWSGEKVTHHGRFGHFDDVTLSPSPVQAPLELWTGGTAPGALRRCGRLADGWLPSGCTPGEAEVGRKVIEEAAAEACRTISPEHFGVSLAYAAAPLGATQRRYLERRHRIGDLDQVVPIGPERLRSLVERFIAVGFSKFVVRPLEEPLSWFTELLSLADAVADLQT